MTNMMVTARRIAAETPNDRNRVVDFLRVQSISIVVVGHWLMAALVIDDGSVAVENVLNTLPWTQPLTWLLQVMPIFFFIGGYSNALSWRSARRNGQPYGGWLRGRLRRLTLPVVPLLTVWLILGWLSLQAGFDPNLLHMASAVALGPTWFLAAYVMIVCLAPVTLSMWDRWGWWSLAFGFALVAVVDFVSIALGLSAVGYLNYVLVWGSVHQLGYAWVDGQTKTSRVRLGLVVVGFLATLSLVWAGPYPVAMVGFDSGELTNSLPPRLTLGFLGMFQAGLVLLMERGLARMLQRTRVWTSVVLVSSQIMTLYLWHLTAMIILIGGGLALSGFGFGLEPFTGLWWLSRPLWMAALTAVTLVLVLVFGRFERSRDDTRPAPSAWRPLVAATMICVGLGSMAAGGISDGQGMHGLLISLPVVGMLIGGLISLPANGMVRER